MGEWVDVTAISNSGVARPDLPLTGVRAGAWIGTRNCETIQGTDGRPMPGTHPVTARP